MGVPDHLYIGRNKYFYHSSSSSYQKIQRVIAQYKKRYNNKYHILKSDSYFGAYKMYHLYMTKIQKI